MSSAGESGNPSLIDRSEEEGREGVRKGRKGRRRTEGDGRKGKKASG